MKNFSALLLSFFVLALSPLQAGSEHHKHPHPHETIGEIDLDSLSKEEQLAVRYVIAFDDMNGVSKTMFLKVGDGTERVDNVRSVDRNGPLLIVKTSQLGVYIVNPKDVLCFTNDRKVSL